MTQQPFYLGTYNGTTETTDLDAVVPGYQALTVVNEQGPGIVGLAIGPGPERGLLAGVIGQAGGLPGQSYTAGVIGSGDGVPGVTALSTSGYSMYALSYDQATENTGSLFAFSEHGGIQTQTETGNALWAVQYSTTNAPALVATSPGWAAGFVGGVIIDGDLFCTGSKNAVIDYPDGSHRALCCMEAPEAWFEDFGRASLAGGSAAIALEARFAALVDDDEYHVFVTPEGDCKGLYVASRSREGFVVRESQDGTSDVPFSYRVAIRRTDIDNERFKAVQLPASPEPAPAGEAARQAEALLHRAEQSRPRGMPPTS
jgi:hypothetical protein